ncbi:MAG: phosphoglycerate dehydrogenase [Acidobacteriota bacterium]
MKILVADPISEEGLARLRDTSGFDVTVRPSMTVADLIQAVREHDALVVRSATKVTAEVLADVGRLKVIGRAGTGVDNIDLDAATRAGVVVINTPGGNSVAAAELTISLLLALARHIPQANAALRAGRWDRKKHVGVEVCGKVIGIVGLGRVGREVARRARGLRMKVVGHDPFVTEAAVADLGVTVVPLPALLADSDFVTLHLPSTEQTRSLIDAAALERMKPGARLINCARGDLVDEAAVLAALESGHLAGAALDVFAKEPPTDRRLVEHPGVVSTPHLGASTREAQVRVGTEIADKIRDFLETGTILDAVNFPSVSREEYAALRPVMVLAERLGRFVGQIGEGGVRELHLCCFGEFNERPLRPLVMAAVKGLLTPTMGDGISYVNALRLAGERGVTVRDGRSSEPTPYAGLLRLTLVAGAVRSVVSGTLFTADRPRIVEVDGVRIECTPSGHLLFFRNRDVPGVVGRIGSILGRAGINIAQIQLGRAQGGEAVSIVNVDSAVGAEVLEEIRALDEIREARTLSV